MADVTVNIRGNASQLRSELDNITPQSQSSGGSSGIIGRDESGSARMIEDVRREMQQRGVLLVPGSSSMSQIINQYKQTQGDATEANISHKYGERRADMRSRMSDDYARIDAEVEQQRRTGMSSITDDFSKSVLEQRLQQYSDSQYRRVGQRYDQEEDELRAEEAEEKSAAERELTEAIKELTEHFDRQSEQGTPDDSFLGRLRAQQRALITERDNAATEEDARSASMRLAGVNEQMRGVMGGGDGVNQGVMRGLKVGGGAMMTANALGSGDIGGGIMGAALMTGNPYAIAGAAVLSGGMAIADTISNATESYSKMAAFSSTAGGRDLENARKHLTDRVPYMADVHGISHTDLGMDQTDFMADAYKRMSSRRMSEGWREESITQNALEKVLALSEGYLGTASKFDRYGQNTTEAVSRLVSLLSVTSRGEVRNFDNAGGADFTKVQEKLDIQQRLMGSYMGLTDKPNYDTANRMVAAFSSTEGITQDSRLGDDIMSFENAIINPQNEMMRTLIYDSINQLFPEFGGNIAEVKKAQQDPEKRAKILPQLIKQMDAIFGDVTTTQGQFAYSSVFQGISLDRLEPFIKGLSEGGSIEQILNGGDTLTEEKTQMALKRGSSDVGRYTGMAGGATTDWTDFKSAVKDGVTSGFSSGLITASGLLGMTLIGASLTKNNGRTDE